MKKSVFKYKLRILNDNFKKNYGENAEDVFTSPGRIELIGNHTDHNNGMVLVSSIDMMITAVCKKNEENLFVYQTNGFPKMVVNILDLEKKENELGSSIGMIRGVLFRMKELGYKIGGVNVSTSTTIFKGAGVSSSAAFELLICQIMNHYFNDDKIEAYELAKIAQFSETEYFGKPCGLLDQSGIALGGINFIDFKNPSSPIIINVKVELSKYDVTIVNTKGNHSKLTKEYAKIKEDMFKVSSFFNKKFLREVNEDEFFAKKEEIIKEFGEDVYLRGKHYFEENRRVIEAFEAINNKDEDTFVRKLGESGDSSFYQLKNCYVKSEEENLPKAILASKKIIKNGSCRVHGGGFAGTILAFTRKDETQKYRLEMIRMFGKNNVRGVIFNSDGTKYCGNLTSILKKSN